MKMNNFHPNITITHHYIGLLLRFAFCNELIAHEDIVYMYNKYLAFFALAHAPLTLDLVTTQAKDSYSGHIYELNVASTIDVLLNDCYEQLHQRQLLPVVLQAYTKEDSKMAIMNVLLDKPSTINSWLWNLAKNDGIQKALSRFYRFAMAVNYVKPNISNYQYKVDTPYATLEVTINLAKPEKDPKDIAKLYSANSAPTEVRIANTNKTDASVTSVDSIASIVSGDRHEDAFEGNDSYHGHQACMPTNWQSPTYCYPQCVLCIENEGLSTSVVKLTNEQQNHPINNQDLPPRQNHRLLRFKLLGKEWFLQFSPYVYYNEHAILISKQHKPMHITQETFLLLLEFVKQVPHYFIGANADIPIVGGSILNHDHYQCGNYRFPIDSAKIHQEFKSNKYHQVAIYHLKWPLTTIRLVSTNAQELISLANQILIKWYNYSNCALGIQATSTRIGHDGNNECQRHNAITPIMRIISTTGNYASEFDFNGDYSSWLDLSNAQKQHENTPEHTYQLDLILRNNRTSDEHPYGIFHPHLPLHHIKQENIGLIEAMGFAILPARLVAETKLIIALLKSNHKYQQNGARHYHVLLAELLSYQRQQSLPSQVGSIIANKDIALDLTEFLPIAKHAHWLLQLINDKFATIDLAALSHDSLEDLLMKEIANRFTLVLEDCAVFKTDEQGSLALREFILACINP